KRALPGGWTWEAVVRRVQGLWYALQGRPEPDVPDYPLANAPPEHSANPTQAQIDDAVEKYARYLGVQTDGRSMTIRVSYRAWTPERAADIANAHLESYQGLQVQAKMAAARAAGIGTLSSAKGRDSVPEVVASPTIQLLRGQESQLIQREADLGAHHGDSYPELKNVRASLRDLRAQIDREIARGRTAALQLV